MAVSIEGKSLEEKKSLLAKCAATTLSSKLIGGEKEFFATMVVDSVLAIGDEDRLNMIGIKKVKEYYVYLTHVYFDTCLGAAIILAFCCLLMHHIFCIVPENSRACLYLFPVAISNIFNAA